MKKTSLVMITALALTSCADTVPADAGQWQRIDMNTGVTGVVVETQNGPVDCVVLYASRGGGISCNWDNK